MRYSDRGRAGELRAQAAKGDTAALAAEWGTFAKGAGVALIGAGIAVQTAGVAASHSSGPHRRAASRGGYKSMPSPIGTHRRGQLLVIRRIEYYSEFRRFRV